MKFTLEVTFGGERLYVCPFVPDYIDKINKVPKLSKDELPNMVTGIRSSYTVIYDGDYSLPFQLCVSDHEWVDQCYMNPTKEFIWHVLTENSQGNLLERYELEPIMMKWKIEDALKMVKWIEIHGGLENIEFVYSIDT